MALGFVLCNCKGGKKARGVLFTDRDWKSYRERKSAKSDGLRAIGLGKNRWELATLTFFFLFCLRTDTEARSCFTNGVETSTRPHVVLKSHLEAKLP